ncbi:MAG: FtsX-like permease family protein [Ornithinimicrobium sp.]
MSARHARRRPDRARSAGAPSLLFRQLRVDPWISVLLALLVAVTSVLVTIGPRILTDLNSRQVAYTVDSLSVLQRDVRATVVAQNATFAVTTDGVQFDPPKQTWAPVIKGLEDVRTEQPEPLRSLLQPGKFFVDVGPQTVAPDDPESDIASIELQYRVDPLLPELVTLVEGDWPAPTIPLQGARFEDDDGTSFVDSVAEVDIALSEDAARQLYWEVGEVRDVPPAGPTRLSGVYVPLDPDDPHWEHSTYGAALAVFNDFDRGKLATAAAYLAPGNPGVTALGASREFHLWYPLDATDVAGDDVAALAAQLGGLTAASVGVVSASGEVGADDAAVDGGQSAEDDQPPSVSALDARFITEIFGVLRELAQQQQATSSLLAVLSAGPIGVLVIVLVLGARLTVTRRRATLALALARGAAPAQIRGTLATEAALLAVPAAALGYVVANVTMPPQGSGAGLAGEGFTGAWPPSEWTAADWAPALVALLVGLAPSLALLIVPATPSLRTTRSDLGAAVGRGRARVLMEIVVISLAVIAVWRLMDRGLVGASPADGAADSSTALAEADVGVDLLVAATPVLLALAAAAMTLRLYPIPLRALTRVLASRTGLSGFLGASRALRDPAGGLVPALAVIVGISVAASSAVLASTISEGAERAAWEANGADIRLSGPRVTDDLVETLRGVPGVAEVARLSESARPIAVSGAGVDARSTTVYLVDDELADAQDAAPLVSPLPEELYDASEGLTVVSGGELNPSDGEIDLGGVGSAVEVAHIDALPGVAPDSAFLVASRSSWEAAGGSVPIGNLVLLSVSPTVDREEVAEAVATQVPNSRVETPQARFDAFTEAPVTAGLGQMSNAAVALTLGLTVLAIVLVQAIGAPGRIQLLALLRTMGTRPRQARSLIAWELAPMLVAASIAGGALGLSVPWLLAQAVDLRGLTGSPTQPEMALDPVSLALMAVLVLVVVIAAVLVSAAIASRTDLAQYQRLGEER